MFFKSPKVLKWYYPNRVWGIFRDSQKHSIQEPCVALTFDDGPNSEITPWVIDFLRTQNIKATFFCVGSNVIKNPEIFEQLLSEGHSVGNHTMNHENGFKTNDETYLDSVERTSHLIDSTLFRPPYGRLRKSVEQKLLKKYQIIMWSWLSFDYDKRISKNRIVRNSKKIKSGDILVFHDNQKTKERLKEILPPIVERLKKDGFQFVKLTEKTV